MERFSQSVRDELARNALTHCQGCIKAELAGIIQMAGSIHLSGQEKLSLSVTTESAGVTRRTVILIKASYHLNSEVRVEQHEKLGRHHRYCLLISSQPALTDMLYELGMMTREHLLEGSINPYLVKENCCRASFLRGAFLAGGSITDPQKKTYHLELVTQNEEFADGLAYLMNLLGLKAKICQRKTSFLVYLKECEAIVRFLSLMNAYSAVIKLEEVRVIKGMRGEVNRRVNCETANLEKTLSASWELVDLINKLKCRGGLGILPSHLRSTAELRLEYPEATLKELGEYHLPPISKSAVNHRLRLIRQVVKNFTEEAGI
jgi:cell division protein WhiA